MQSDRASERITDQHHGLVHQPIERFADCVDQRLRSQSSLGRAAEAVARHVGRDHPPRLVAQTHQRRGKRPGRRADAMEHDGARQIAPTLRFEGVQRSDAGPHRSTRETAPAQREAGRSLEHRQDARFHSTFKLTHAKHVRQRRGRPGSEGGGSWAELITNAP
jgi:hypothetical protein